MTTMRAIAIREPGPPDVLTLVERPVPVPAPAEILVRVHAAGVNKPDLLQRKGGYPPPPGASDLPGLEIAGVVSACGAAVKRWKVGDRVAALLGGGGYAEYAVADEEHALPVPETLTMTEAAALPETVFTVWANVFERGRLVTGETLLVHGGSGGIGSTAIQLGKLFGATVAATAGSDERAAFCRKIGADTALNYRTSAFEEIVSADVILDVVGAPYLAKNLKALKQGGRLVIIGLQGGYESAVDLRGVLMRHLTITASTLRPRPKAEKARLARAVETAVWPLVAARKFVPQVDKVLPLALAAEAHRMLEASAHLGKVVLDCQKL